MEFTAIDLSKIPAPDIVEALNFESIFSAMLVDLQARDATFTALLESDPAYKILEVAAYRELLLRQRVNDAARACMLASALGTDLDNLIANFNVERRIVTPADPNTLPPTPAVYEDDDTLRKRAQLAFEGLSTAGPSGSYIYHGLSADVHVADIAVDAVTFHLDEGVIVIDNTANLVTPMPGNVAVTVLSTVDNGFADSNLLAAVDAAINNDRVRPLTDFIVVRSAEIVNFVITATLYFFDGPSSATVLAHSTSALQDYLTSTRKIGRDVTLSGIYAALHQPGVSKVTLAQPTVDIVIENWQSGNCTNIQLINGGLYV